MKASRVQRLGWCTAGWVALLVCMGSSVAQTSPAFREVSWLELVPPDWKPQERIDQKRAASLKDDDALAQELMKELREILDTAPTVPRLDGAKIRMPGYIVPLETGDKGLREFLLVPYFGACIHTPPPPANQIVHVTASSPVSKFGSMSAVWVSGTLRVMRRDSGAMGISGYTLNLAHIEAYKAN